MRKAFLASSRKSHGIDYLHKNYSFGRQKRRNLNYAQSFFSFIYILEVRLQVNKILLHTQKIYLIFLSSQNGSFTVYVTWERFNTWLQRISSIILCVFFFHIYFSAMQLKKMRGARKVLTKKTFARVIMTWRSDSVQCGTFSSAFKKVMAFKFY